MVWEWVEEELEKKVGEIEGRVHIVDTKRAMGGKPAGSSGIVKERRPCISFAPRGISPPLCT